MYKCLNGSHLLQLPYMKDYNTVLVLIILVQSFRLDITNLLSYNIARTMAIKNYEQVYKCDLFYNLYTL